MTDRAGPARAAGIGLAAGVGLVAGALAVADGREGPTRRGELNQSHPSQAIDQRVEQAAPSINRLLWRDR
jgi:hypothetical protein